MSISKKEMVDPQNAYDNSHFLQVLIYSAAVTQNHSTFSALIGLCFSAVMLANLTLSSVAFPIGTHKEAH